MHPIETPDKTFHDGDGVSELGTILPAWWLNQIQSELLGVLELAGVAPNKTNPKQLKAAIENLLTAKIGADGDQTITNGTLTFGRPNIWTKMIWPSGQGKWIFEANPASSEAVADSIRINIRFDEPGKKTRMLRFDHIGESGETVAYQRWVISKAQEVVAAIAVPSGTVIHFAGQTAPAGWLKANGAAVSRTAYAALFAAIGTTYGAGDGRSTFNLPDLRGEFIRGWDDGRGIDRGRALGSAQGDAIRNITGSIDTGSNSGHQLFDEATATGALAISQRRWRAWTSDTQDGRNNPAAFDFDASRVVPTAPENRPRNIALLACIKI